MSLSKNPYRGCRDFFPKEKRLQNFIFSKMRETAELFGHEPYDGPMLEEVELYRAKSGEELINEQIYSFHDRGERFVAIRPEMTPTLARMVAQIHRETPKPIRWYAIPNLMRYEKPQKGRLREHWQFNCDIFGAPPSMGELEIFQLAIAFLQSFGATEKHFEILVNDRRFVDHIFRQIMKLDDNTVYKLYKIVDKSTKVSREALEEMVAALAMPSESSGLFYKYLAIANFDECLDFIDKFKITTEMTEFRNLITLFKELGLLKFLKYSPTIVRGLDYYTGVVFEIFDKNPENRRAISGGGAYSNLLTIFNEPALSGVGFGLGDVTLTDFLITHQLLNKNFGPEVDMLVTFQNENALLFATRFAQTLRANKIKTLFYPQELKFNKVFPYAEKQGASFVALIGEQEVKNGQVQIKNLSNKEQHNLPINDITTIIKTIKPNG
ncbi:MAG: histidine--tRNA ligase [Bdellovibrionales bacterium RIFOXYD12_FULL_39_22]|nr:MAG: histidine--tRNA ligase [Bdellovibrionales bacterium RIFOXYB1_FULL_39_21]OFZ43623.1 MAG: histidine--tRNA ligase [Bdellovibrionales bacterium RIFOXYC12_FULL_39_17]OFZ44642.1 MAG: histidine--tRNA ligase [Bdellovibrionales bacterium RIFOXYC1_FULL_39_130]OFZ73687.1 MAG: histidine--tRNA ligase [Bdellovibrionales bacterium RIFOXYC2_FULL_39_8]OFZ76401.1 MAG: histidine--tRNA ligase [Bdellovibrionales bacterium RIFOXYD1_FULL_39_84]OFZ94667.1 MAG: histidine--tRNA ligase [Bdellovibrionales bacteri